MLDNPTRDDAAEDEDEEEEEEDRDEDEDEEEDRPKAATAAAGQEAVADGETTADGHWLSDLQWHQITQLCPSTCFRQPARPHRRQSAQVEGAVRPSRILSLDPSPPPSSHSRSSTSC